MAGQRHDRVDIGQRLPPPIEVDGPPVVGIDEMKIPQLGPLIEIGNAGRRDLEDHLRERVDEADTRDTLLEGQKRGQELRGRRP